MPTPHEIHPPTPARIALIGVTGHLGREMLCTVTREFPDSELVLMARADSEEHLRSRLDAAAEWAIGSTSERRQSQMSYLRVDLSRKGLGLDGPGMDLLRGVEEVFFLASSISFTMSAEEAIRANVDTLRNFLGTCSELRSTGALRTLHYVSTAYVSTTEESVAKPSPCDPHAQFRNNYEYSKACAEQEVIDSKIPALIYRPSIIIGSSKNGRAHGFDTVYNFVRSFARGRLPFVPADPDHTLDIVPSDYVADTIVALARTQRSGTFHISAGKSAPTVGEVYESVRRVLADRQGAHNGLDLRFLSPELTAGIESAPRGLISSRLRSASRLISAYLPFLSAGVPEFDNTATVGATGLRPPALEEYAGLVWAYALDHDFGARGRHGSPRAQTAERASRASALRRTDPGTLDGLLARSARRAPRSTALVTGETTLTYAALETSVHERARALADDGVAAGTRVGLRMAHDTTSVITFLAALRAGARVLLLPEEGSPPPAWGGAPVLDPAGSPVGTGVGVGTGAGSPTHAGGVVFATSGTTGEPKLVQHRGRSLAESGRATAQATGLDGTENIALLLPLFHAFAAGIVVPAALHAGACMALPVRGLTGLDALSRTRATHAVGVPTHFHRFVEEWREREAVGDTGVDLSSWTVSICGDDPVLPALREEFERTFLRPMAQGYGLSEALLLCFTAAVEPGSPDCVGRPLPGVRISVRGPEGDTLPHGRRGRIWVSAPTAMSGYVGAEHRRSEWIDTGDIGWSDEGGRLHVSGRFLRQGGIAEVAEVNGRSVTSREVENALLSSGKVRRAKVVFTEDTTHAFVVARGGVRDLDPGDLSALLTIPVTVTVVPHLAETAVGKVDRTALHEMIASGRAV
ncbi:acyl-CoA synthetase (AMP-forming)/AMP-acid ligase II [Nocardiopsis sp. Huas11]|uniref:AMP-binding protein n=1 Tax=Nocardiopsis sp. Huas11 TaxID=2183912 RepID=UPI000EAC84F8|nr:AMP-binding protein [Nocardiopsis sp. Huas11]RKS09569.1 acyl-CoA synthetase (AMP-forming)/AMP-acid ligase II [Nocardiopsis sp. Huas11]